MTQFSHTHVRVNETPILTALAETEYPATWENVGDPVILLEGKLYGHPLAGLLWERKLKRSTH